MKITLQQYAKLAVALVAAAIVVVQSALSDGHVSSVEWAQIGIAVVTAFGVWITANIPGVATYAKTAVAAVLAVLNLLVTYLPAGPITSSEWVNLAIAALTAAGVFAVPNNILAGSSTDLLPGREKE